MWQQLKILWGGSAAALCLTNCRTTILHAEKQRDCNNNYEINECNESMHNDAEKGVTQNRVGRAENILESASNNSLSALNLAEQQSVSNQNRKRKNSGAITQKRKNAGLTVLSIQNL